jgi:hypothetical protein
MSGVHCYSWTHGVLCIYGIKREMKKYTVRLMTQYMAWEDVEADSPEDAIGKCEYPFFFDCNEPHQWVAAEQEEE